ncbi:hypothetical protein [Spirulina sp. 06S082]|uniref:hypothetical protein n=1 Tax=Spirulina sp. 06S082 TaxID=3110248 RepID=UPI002B20A3E7|nr:hypothetical protein [Spirulina sp. 06S082]MEA5469882.1 hypothetical protein [Spirulina sp. 06S082]
MSKTPQSKETREDFLIFCSDYAHNSLKTQDREVRESLVRRQIPPQKVRRLETSYNITIKLGNNLNIQPVRKIILYQIDAAANFLRDFQIGILGQRTTLFQLYEIEFSFDRNSKFTFDFSAGKLFIKLPYWKAQWFSEYLKYTELRQLWTKGEHLPRLSPIRRVWWLFDPLGEFRSNLKSTLILAVQKQILGIDKLLIRFGLLEAEENSEQSGKLSSSIPQSFKQGTIAYLKSAIDEKKLGFNLEFVLENQDDNSLLKLLQKFQQNLTDPQQIEEIIDVAALTLQDTLRQEQSNVDIKMFGLVNVGNYHRIDVDLNLSTGYLRKYVEIIPRKADIKAIQFGLVNVYTIDDITVTPNFHSAIKLDFKTAALEKALQEIS